MTASPSDDFISEHGAGWRAGFLAGERTASRRAGVEAGGGGGSNAPGSPLLGRLLVEWPGLFEAEVLPRLDPTTRAMLAQVGRAGRDAVRLPANLAIAGRTVGVKLKLRDFIGSAKWLAWAKENGCPWVAQTCDFLVSRGHPDALKWAQVHHCPWNSTTLRNAATRGDVGVVEWVTA